jgi:purine-binding chemotaxis protein CheW
MIAPIRQQFCTFFLDDLFFGVEVEKVQEVLRYQEMTRVPLAPPAVRGLINLRGQIVTAIDLRCRLDLTEHRGAQPMNVVVQGDDGATSLLVDQIGDVCEVEEEAFEPRPQTLQGVARQLIRGTYKLKDQLLLVLDLEQVLSLGPCRDLADSNAPSTRQSAVQPSCAGSIYDDKAQSGDQVAKVPARV